MYILLTIQKIIHNELITDTYLVEYFYFLSLETPKLLSVRVQCTCMSTEQYLQIKFCEVKIQGYNTYIIGLLNKKIIKKKVTSVLT